MKTIIIPTQFQNRISEMLKEYSVVYLAAYAGMGKTSVVREYLKKRKIGYTYVQAEDDDFFECLATAGEGVVVIDDFQDISQENEEYLKANFHKLLRKHRFVILSRAFMPAWMKPYQIIGQLGSLDNSVLNFTSKEARAYLEAQQIYLEEVEIYKICKAIEGYPLALVFWGYSAKMEEGIGANWFAKMRRDVFDYLDEVVFFNWDREVYKFLLEMAGFESFSLELAAMVSGYPEVQRLVDGIEKKCSFFTRKGQEYQMLTFVREYFLSKQERMLSESEIYNIYHNAGLYYELRMDLKNAMKYYSKCGDEDKVRDLLVRNSNLHPGNASYLEVEEYYRAFPKERVLENPDLMCGMCMLCSLSLQVEESEYWYKALSEYCKNLKKTDREYKYIKGRLYWLDISLPHRGSVNVESLLVSGMNKLKNKEFSVQEISVTSNLPSVLNGGKDFSIWVTRANVLYPIMKLALPIVLGKGGEGLPEICMAEAMLEQADANTYQIVNYLNQGIYQAAAKGKIETRFVGNALMHRLYLAEGNVESAYNLLTEFEKEVDPKQYAQMHRNIKAMYAQYDLYVGKRYQAENWVKEEAPNEKGRFNVFERYRYMVKARCYIAQQRYTEAISLLDRMVQYGTAYDRTIIMIQARTLLAIVFYRMKDASWKDMLSEALEEAQKYKYIQMFADEGAALLPLLQEYDKKLDKEYKKKLLHHVKQATVSYPSYLKIVSADVEKLTATERQVLKLLGRGMKNKEISEFLNISLNTVAYHTKNIYQKLGVNNRTQATNIAKSMDL